MTDPKIIEDLVAAGWIVLRGNDYVMTPLGRRKLRQGLPGTTFGKTAPIDSVRARSRPPIKKKSKRQG
jgi:hypothetical protein